MSARVEDVAVASKGRTKSRTVTIQNRLCHVTSKILGSVFPALIQGPISTIVRPTTITSPNKVQHVQSSRTHIRDRACREIISIDGDNIKSIQSRSPKREKRHSDHDLLR